MMNMAQELQFERIKLASFNNFDGHNVAYWLRENQHLWKSFVFGRFKYFELIELRDMHTGSINADTLYILTTKDQLAGLLVLINKFDANEVDYYDRDEQCLLGGGLGKDEVFVHVWWD